MTNLNDKELGQVSGGYATAIISLDAGDVFVDNQMPNLGVVVSQNYPFVNASTMVYLQHFDFRPDNTLNVDPTPVAEPISILSSCYTYSPSLSGTIPYN